MVWSIHNVLSSVVYFIGDDWVKALEEVSGNRLANLKIYLSLLYKWIVGVEKQLTKHAVWDVCDLC